MAELWAHLERIRLFLEELTSYTGVVFRLCWGSFEFFSNYPSIKMSFYWGKKKFDSGINFVVRN